MTTETALQSELGTTDIASKWFFASVNALVTSAVVLPFESFPADVAAKRGFARMNPFVHLVVAFELEHLAAVFAKVRWAF